MRAVLLTQRCYCCPGSSPGSPYWRNDSITDHIGATLPHRVVLLLCWVGGKETQDVNYSVPYLFVQCRTLCTVYVGVCDVCLCRVHTLTHKHTNTQRNTQTHTHTCTHTQLCCRTRPTAYAFKSIFVCSIFFLCVTVCVRACDWMLVVLHWCV